MTSNSSSTPLMFIILILAASLSFLTMYFNANIILALYGERASKRQKMLFAFISGTVISLFPIYLVHYLGLLNYDYDTAPLVLLLFRNFNPLFALLYWYLGIKILGLSSLRSLRIINIACLCLILEKNTNLFVGAAFFGQNPWHYDQYKDLVQQLSVLVITVVLYIIATKRVKLLNTIRVVDSSFFNQRNEIIIFVCQSSMLYVFTVSLPFLISNQIVAFSLILIIVSLVMISSIQRDSLRAIKMELENKNVHINTLNASVEDFRGIKHDFYNILHTYAGYLEIGDLKALRNYHEKLLSLTVSAGTTMDLKQKMESNPALITLLLNKADYANKVGVLISFSILADINDFYIDSIDFFRALACLLDNAIEAAADSEKKHVDFIIKEKAPQSKLIIISNSTSHDVDVSEIVKPGVTSKVGHSGIGLTTVRKVLEKHENSSFITNYYNHEFTAYVQLRPEISPPTHLPSDAPQD